MQVEVRKATINDLSHVMNLNKSLFDYEIKNKFDDTLDPSWVSKNKVYFKDRISKKNSLTLVAVDGEQIIGYLIGSIGKPEHYRKFKVLAEMENMIVLPTYRGHGIGEALVTEFLKWAKKKKAIRVRAVASFGNVGAINFYKKMEFKEYNLTLERNLI